MPPEELDGKIVIGEFVDIEKKTYNEKYEQLKLKLAFKEKE